MSIRLPCLHLAIWPHFCGFSLASLIYTPGDCFVYSEWGGQREGALSEQPPRCKHAIAKPLIGQCNYIIIYVTCIPWTCSMYNQATGRCTYLFRWHNSYVLVKYTLTIKNGTPQSPTSATTFTSIDLDNLAAKISSIRPKCRKAWNALNVNCNGML